MDAERWARVKALFHSLAELDPEARRAPLERAGREDPELRREVEALLASHDGAGDFLERPARGGFDDDAPETRRIGRYRILEELGSGGMGVVYLAERDDREYRQRVAIKLIRGGLASEEIVRRFRTERQILAGLDHPNIARLLDGGTDDDGSPYLVMEYVDGVPIDRYCDEHRLSIRRRLELFLEVCAAVQFAHQNLVIHRDLKPGNVQVTADGTVKLLDFGIAKLLAPEAGMPTVAQTATGLLLMTPEYASPEQVRGGPITTATDVYALGLLLYELLTGHRPQKLATRAPAEVVRVICDQVPERPSTVVARRDDARRDDARRDDARRDDARRDDARRDDGHPAEPGARRGLSPRKLRRRLAGDLDTIVARAIDKDPRRRYGSAAQLADDLRRHLEGLPVRARPDTAFYRFRKLVQRHKAATAAVVLVFVFALVASWQRYEVALERDAAEEARRRAERMAEFLVDLFEIPDPSRARGETVTAVEILAQGVAEIERLGDQPVTQALLLDTIGRVYGRLGLTERARPALEQGLALRRRHLGEDHYEVASSLSSLASVAQEEGRYDDSLALSRQALEILRRTRGDEHPNVAQTLTTLGMLHLAAGEHDDAEARLGEALALSRRLLGDEHHQIGAILSALGLLDRRRGDLASAEARLREALAIERRTLGSDHRSTAETINRLALVLRQRGALDEAERLYREALEIRRRVLGRDHPDVALSLNNLALFVLDRGDRARAETLLRRSLALYERAVAPDHPARARALNNLGVVLLDGGRVGEARTLLAEALAIRRRALAPDHRDLAYTLTPLARAHLAEGRPDAAAPLLEEALAIRRASFPEGHWRIAETASLLGLARLRQGRLDEARALLSPAVATLEAERPGRPETERARAGLAELGGTPGQPRGTPSTGDPA